MPGTLAELYGAILRRQGEPQGALSQHTYGGIPRREAYPSEVDFFKRTGVPAYAAEDNKVVVSPVANLSDAQRKALEINEAARVWMRQNNLTPNFQLTQQQSQNLGGTSYHGADDQYRQQTIAARLLSGDPSGGQATPEQDAFVKRLRYSMGLLGLNPMLSQQNPNPYGGGSLDQVRNAPTPAAPQYPWEGMQGRGFFGVRG